MKLKYIKGLGKFFWGLLIGDTPGLSLGVVVLIIAVLGARTIGFSPAYIIAPIVIIATIALSINHETKKFLKS